MNIKLASNEPLNVQKENGDVKDLTGAYFKPSGGIPNSDLASPSPFVAGTGTNSAVMDGNENVATGDYSIAEGQKNTASGKRSHAEGYQVKASGSYSHAEGASTFTEAAGSHAEGQVTMATAAQSHSEGQVTIASKTQSHAEGFCVCASGPQAHAEGGGGCTYILSLTGDASATTYSFNGTGEILVDYNTFGSSTLIQLLTDNLITVGGTSVPKRITSCTISGVIGSNVTGTITVNETLSSSALSDAVYNVPRTIAKGALSHVEGRGNISLNSNEHAEGKWNKSNTHATDTSKQTLHSVGCGDSDTRKNAFEIMQNGDMYIKGIGGYDGTNAGASGVSTLVGVIGDIETILQSINGN